MTARWWWVAFLVGSACGYVSKPPEPDRHLAFRTTGSMFEARGVRLAALPDERARAVEVSVRYPVGSVDDPPGKEGLAHLVEHLLFDVELGGADSIQSELGRLALSWNAETREDATVYETVADPSALDAIVGLEVDRVAIGCDGLTPAIFAREREVVLNELRQRQGLGGAELGRAVREALYPTGHPYRRLDTVETVAKLELKDACDFLAGPYRRGPVLVVASGALTDETLRAAAKNHFGQFPERVPGARAAVPAAVAARGTVRVKADVETPHLLAAWPLPPRNSREFRLLSLVWPSIATHVEGQGYEFKWGGDSTASVLGGVDAPVLLVDTELDRASAVGDAQHATEYGAQIAREALQRGDAEERGRTWQRLWQARVATLLSRWDSLAGRNVLAQEILAEPTPDPRFLVGRMDELIRASPKDVAALVEQYLAPDRAHYIVVEMGGVGTGDPATYAGGGAESHMTRVDGALADKPLPRPQALAPLDYESYQLDNGLTVVLWPHASTPIVQGRLYIDSGSAHEPRGADGLAYLVGATAVEPDSLVFGHRELATSVDDLVARLTVELRAPGTEIDDDAKEYLKRRLGRQGARANAAYLRDLLSAVYGPGHPYARGGLTPNSVDLIHRDLVMDWARAHVVPKNAVLVIAGQFDAEVVKRHIEYDVAHVAGGKDSPAIDADPQPRRAFVRGITDQLGTIELDVAFPGGNGIGSDHPKRLVLEAMLNDLLAPLREKRALTYGFTATYSPRRAGGLWLVHGEADPHRAAEAAAALAQILADVRGDAENYRAAFVHARAAVLEAQLASAQDTGAIADRLVAQAMFHLSDDYDGAVARAVSALTLADMHAFIANELAADRQVFGAFGGEVAVGRALATAQQVAP